jgi:hypothetical protein
LTHREISFHEIALLVGCVEISLKLKPTRLGSGFVICSYLFHLAGINILN